MNSLLFFLGEETKPRSFYDAVEEAAKQNVLADAAKAMIALYDSEEPKPWIKTVEDQIPFTENRTETGKATEQIGFKNREASKGNVDAIVQIIPQIQKRKWGGAANKDTTPLLLAR